MPPKRLAPRSTLGPRPDPPARAFVPPPIIPPADTATPANATGRVGAAAAPAGAAATVPVVASTTATPATGTATTTTTTTATTSRTPRTRTIPASRPRRTPRPANNWLETVVNVVAFIAGLGMVFLVAFIITMFVTGRWPVPATITVTTPTVTIPVTVAPASRPASALPAQERPTPQFKAIERAKEGNTFDRRGCYAWYDSQGFDSEGEEFWNEGTQTCR